MLNQMKVPKAQSMKHGRKYHPKEKRRTSTSEQSPSPVIHKSIPPNTYRHKVSPTPRNVSPLTHRWNIISRHTDVMNGTGLDANLTYLLDHSQKPCRLCGSNEHSMTEICHRTSTMKYNCPISSFKNITHQMPTMVNLSYDIGFDKLIETYQDRYFELQKVLERYFSLGFGNRYSLIEKNDIRKRIYRAWSNQAVKKSTERQEETIKNLTLPVCRSCGSHKHGLLTCRMGNDGRWLEQYVCPYRLCDDWYDKPNLQSPYGYKWLSCPKKVTDLLEYNISEINNFCDIYETKGFGKHLLERSNYTFRKECELLCENHYDGIRRKELVKTTIIFILCIIMIWSTHLNLGS